MVAAATPTHYARWLHQADDYPLQSIPTGMAFPSHEVFLILFFLSLVPFFFFWLGHPLPIRIFCSGVKGELV